MKFKKEEQSVDASVLLRRGSKIFTGANMWRQSVGQILKERLSRDCPTWGFIPYMITKPRHYFGCQEMLADWSVM